MGLASSQFRRAELDYKITEDYSKTMVAPTRYVVKMMLRRESWYIERRQQRGGQLHARACQLGISPVKPALEASVAFMSYPLHTSDRKGVMREGRAQGIEITPGFVSPVDPLGPRDWINVGYRAGSCPVAEYLSENTITVPVRDWARKKDIDNILGFLEAMKARRFVEAIGRAKLAGPAHFPA